MLKRKILKTLLRNVIIFMILIPLIMYCNKAFATTTMTLSANFSSSTISSGDEAIIDIAIDKFDGTGEGVNAYIFSLEFNTNEFEFVKAEGQNNWNSPAYNETNVKAGNGKFTATRSSFTKETGSIVKITLKAKNNFGSSNMPDVKISGISFATKEENKTQKVVLSDINIVLESGQGQSSENTGGNEGESTGENTGEGTSEGTGENTGEGTGKSTGKNTITNTSSNKSTATLPNTGIESQIWITAFGILIINLLVVYFRYNKIYKYI